MKRTTLALLLSGLCAATHAFTNVPADTVKTDSAVLRTTYSKLPFRSLGTFAIQQNDDYLFHTYAGQNVLNTLRGRVPGLSLGVDPASGTGGPRGAASMIVIDGLPYSSQSAESYNLNAFEYDYVQAVGSGNALIPYGGPAGSGAFLLQSKTGKDIDRPSIEFNSFPSLTWSDVSDQSQTLFGGSIAYAQDYGAVDTRVSVNSIYYPEPSWTRTSEALRNFVRINTGWDITKKLNARLILDGMARKYQASWEFSGFGLTNESSLDHNGYTRQAALQLNFDVNDWLSLSSQGALGQIGGDEETFTTRYFTNGTTQHVHDQHDFKERRKFLNLIASANKAVSDNVSLSAFAGGQVEHNLQTRALVTINDSGTSGAWSTTMFKTNSIVAGAGASVKNYLFTNLNYRYSKESAYSSDADLAPSWSLSSAFVFTEAFGWKSPVLTFGKIRASAGKTSMAPTSLYPRLPLTIGGTTYIPNPSLNQYPDRQLYEFGTDLGLLRSRVNLAVNYFNNVDEQTIIPVSIPGGGNGAPIVYVNIGEMHYDGWEVLLTGTAIKRKNTALNTTLTWTTYQHKLESTFDDGGTVGVLGSPIPDWVGGIFNEFRIGSFRLNALVNAVMGGDVLVSTPGGGYQTYDNSQVRLQDLSVGYRIPVTDVKYLKRADVSIACRNIWRIYSAYEEQGPLFTSINPQTASLSITLGF